MPVALLAAWLGSGAVSAAEPPAGSGRAVWTASKVVGSPEPPPPYRVVRAFPGLKFEHPLVLVRYPGEGPPRFVVGEQAGVLSTFTDRPGAKPELFFDLRKEIRTVGRLAGAKEVEAVYGLAFHPDFARNRQCFVCYTLRASEPGKPNLPDGTRVSRFVVTETDPPRVDPASEEVLLSFLQGGHNGGDLQFGPDGKLYVSTGDAASPNPPDPFNTGQDISDLLSSVLRIDVDRKDAGKAYAVPADNPFVGVAGARPEVWAYGFRNPWRMSFDRQTGELYVGDVGWELWEMVHRVERGGNYGWSATEGPQPIRSDQSGPTPVHPALIELPHTVSSSVTGGVVYRGKKFPELVGSYVFGDWETRRLWAAKLEGGRASAVPEVARPSVRIVAFAEDRDGEIYFLDYEGGTVHTIERNTAREGSAPFPTRLSQTGLFADTTKQEPMPGVVPFAVNSRQWQDGATSQSWFAFPGGGQATLHEQARPVPGMVDWHSFRMHFPKGAVLARTVSLAGRRLETQLLHFDGIDWSAYTYAWREDQADADLVPAEGAEVELRDGGRVRTWPVHSRSQCMSCHSTWSGYALGFQAEQLNRPGPDGRNQLVAFTEAGYLRRAAADGASLPPFDAATAARQRKLADPTDGRAPLAARARSYLHANCGHCHVEGGGGTVDLRLTLSATDAEMKAIDARPARGDFGLPDARVIRPGEPESSTLYFRMAKFGRDRMPHLGSERPDEDALAVIGGWIAGMRHRSAPQARPTDADPARSLSRPATALPLARRLGRGELPAGERSRLLAEAARLPTGPTRDLFTGFFPADTSTGRKLGTNPRPRTVLALGGDPAKGEALFWSEAVKCGTCHKVGDRGKSVGPELTTIGRQRSREELLESVLEPSRRIDPKYATFVAVTAGGVPHTGLLVSRDPKRVVLRDAKGQEVVLAGGDVEELRPTRASLMPDGQLADLSPQEAADLLAYLASRR